MRTPPIAPALALLLPLLSFGCQTGPTEEASTGAHNLTTEWRKVATDEFLRLTGPAIDSIPPSELAVMAELAVRNTEAKYAPQIQAALEEGGASPYYAIAYARTTRRSLPDRLLSDALKFIADRRQQVEATPAGGAGK